MARVSNLANEQEISALFRAILGCYFSFTFDGPMTAQNGVFMTARIIRHGEEAIS